MDKYDEDAVKFWPLGTAREKHVLAAFGRECASEAYRNSAAMIGAMGVIRQGLREMCEALNAKAAALRAAGEKPR